MHKLKCQNFNLKRHTVDLQSGTSTIQLMYNKENNLVKGTNIKKIPFKKYIQQSSLLSKQMHLCVTDWGLGRGFLQFFLF